MLAQLVKKYPQDVRLVYRHFPLPGHDKALRATQASEAAGLQGKFWEMHDGLFDEFARWAIMPPAEFDTFVISLAQKIGLDVEKFQSDYASQKMIDKALALQQEAISKGLGGTPYMLINGRPYNGPRDIDSLSAIVRLYQLDARQYSSCPPMTIDVKKQYIATMKTTKGDIVIQLYPDKAPITVNSFVFLSKQGFYNDVPFHRVIPGFVAQGGDPSGSGIGGPGYAFKDEISDLKYDREGILGMANAGSNTNGSQFFITLAPLPDLNGRYTIFGRVIKGMEVAKSLNSRDASRGDIANPADKIIQILIEER